MNFVPFRVKSILHISSHYSNVGACRRQRDMICIALTRRLGILLSHRKPTHDFEHQVPLLITDVPVVKKILKLRVHIKPAVRVSVALVTHPVGFLTSGRVNNFSCHSNALLFHDQAVRMVNMVPQAGIALSVGRWSWWRRGWWRGWRDFDELRPDPANQVVLGPDMVEATVRA